jgi:parallel beta-helix repeat protein
MAHVFADRVLDSTSTTGTGALTLNSPSFNGYQNARDVLEDDDTIYLTVSHRLLPQWEIAEYTYGAGGDTLTRTEILSSSNEGNAVNFSSGIKDVVGGLPAIIIEDLVAIAEDPTMLAASVAAAATSASGAAGSAAAAEAAAEASGAINFYDTKSAANAALAGLSNLAVVEVFVDESRNSLRTRYRKESGVYVFKLYIGPSVIDVSAHGATGDGVTNDTASIQAAIDGAPDGAKIVFPPGTYLVDENGLTVVSRSDLVIDGQLAVIKFTAAADNTRGNLGLVWVYIDDCANCVWTRTVLDGQAFDGAQIAMSNSANCEISYNTVTGGGYFSQIGALGNEGCRYLFNSVSDGIIANGAGGLKIGYYATDELEIEPVVFGNVVSDTGGSAISMTCTGGVVYGNNCQGAVGSGIIFNGALGFTTTNLAITGNVCRNNGFSGIQCDVVYLTEDDVPSGITITGNVCSVHPEGGIALLTIDNSTCVGNSCSDNLYGIVIDETSNTTISANSCFDTRAAGARTQVAGILVNAGVGTRHINGVIVVGNSCYNNTQDGISGIAVGASDEVNGLTVASNQCRNNSRYGVLCVNNGAFTRLAVNGNNCSGNTTADLRVDVLDAAINDNVYTTQESVQSYLLTNNSTTPSVLGGRSVFTATNSAPTSITNFTNGVDGQEITIYATNANTTLVTGGSIRLAGDVNFAMGSNSTVRLRRLSTLWVEVGRAA